MNVAFSFPIRIVQGESWCSLANMGIKRVDIVAYGIQIKDKHSFAGGHRHRYAVVHDDIHILFLKEDIPLNIQEVKAKEVPAKRRHDKRR